MNARWRMLAAASCVLAFWHWPSAVPAAEYPAVEPGYSIELPRDAGSHPEFRTEWWYVTGWIEDDAQRTLGFQVTFFRSRMRIDERNLSRFAPHELLFAHAAISDPAVGRLLHDQRAARAGFDLAQARSGATDVFIDDWSLKQIDDEFRAHIIARDFTLDLKFTSTQPPLLQGDAGYSRKGSLPSLASYYYSLPQLAVSGTLTRDTGARPVRGTAWLDHEWSSAILEPAAVGWDWIGINLDDGGALMAFRMRDTQGRQLWAGGSHRAPPPSAAVATFASADIEWQALRSWRSPHSGVEYPVEWRVRAGDRTLTLRPLMDDQETDARRSTGTLYWEGAVEAFDVSGERIGRGYLELTGYGSRLRM